MEPQRFKMFCFLLKCVLFVQLTYSINHHRFGAEAVTQSELHERLSKIEAQNYQHKNEISVLKTNAVEDRKEIHKLRDRVAQLEASAFTYNTESKTILKRRNRPVRLLPPHLYYVSKDNKTKNAEEGSVDRFYGPPTNCRELRKLGYTLNGYYLIKGKDSGSANSSKIQVVYCQYQQPQMTKPSTNVLENLIGNVEVKTRNVHFYVQRTRKFSNGMLTYDKGLVNVGGAMNLSTGVFSVPVPGIYHFDFSGAKENTTLFSKIYLQVNSEIAAGTYMDSLPNNLVASLTASLKLRVHDRVNIYVYSGILRPMVIHFAGWLVEENLSVLA